MEIEVGKSAPDFTLYDSGKSKVRLSDFKGQPLLLLFFPFAFSSVCTKELCSVRDNIAVYNNVNAKVLGISVDSLYSLARFRNEQQLNFTLLSDFNKEVSNSYGVLYETFGYNMKGVSKRAAFVIDREGVVRYVEVLNDAGDLPNFEAIIQTLHSIN